MVPPQFCKDGDEHGVVGSNELKQVVLLGGLKKKGAIVVVVVVGVCCCLLVSRFENVLVDLWGMAEASAQ
jgi:hypothetical protein